ncbi:hypothetical protein A3Q56_00278, partial [Intoshia linei]
MSKLQYFEKSQCSIIDGINFEVLTPENFYKMSYGQIMNPNLYNPAENGKKVNNGPLDLFMGTTNKKETCKTCQKNNTDCVGHFGHIKLELPVFHVGYFRMVINILQQICKSCSRLLMPDILRDKYTKKLFKAPSYIQKKAMRKKYIEECQKIKMCIHCMDYNGTVKCTSLLEIGHVKYRNVTNDNVEKYIEPLKCVNSDLIENDSKFYKNHVMILSPLCVRGLFNNITDKDKYFLCMGNGFNDPRALLINYIPVPPTCIRPSVMSQGQAGSREDDLTIKLIEIMYMNQELQLLCKSNWMSNEMLQSWKYLQIKVAQFVDSDLAGVPIDFSNKSGSRGVIQRLKGKYGRFRGNLSGKRVDFSGRSVISPDPNLKINQVGVPMHMAKILTFPEIVNKLNIEHLRRTIKNGSDIHPGANFLNHNGNKFFLAYGKRNVLAKNLKLGDIVERHLTDDDVVLFNRQPSLHKLSIQAFRSKILPGRTLRFNECCCNPFNADFDGDEMNIHVPQTYEAKSEAIHLMESKKNIINPRNGEPLIAAIQDFITGAFLLTHLDVYFSYSQTCKIICTILSQDLYLDQFFMPTPAILKPGPFWTGKQIFSIMIRPNKGSNVKVNLECKTKMYRESSNDFMNETYCRIRNSYLLMGVVDKSTLGGGSKNNIFYNILRDYGDEMAALSMWRLSRMIPYYLSNRGFSIGISDVTPSQRLIDKKNKLLETGYGNCTEYIQLTKNNQLPVQPGMTEDETLESKILKELSVIRDHAGQVCLKELPYTNGPLVMALSGSKGSNINISQMIACVGQQAISGKRIPDGFYNRSLPHFKQFNKEPAAKGFVSNSFYSGLTPTEFFFHTMAGREGLVDTAVKTAETGYMQRRLVKALEDIAIQYDGTVRNSEGDIIQFTYGDDNLDPSFIENNMFPTNFSRIWMNALSRNKYENEKKISDFDFVVREIYNRYNGSSSVFFQKMMDFILVKFSYIKGMHHKMSSKNTNSTYSTSIYHVTDSHVYDFVQICLKKYQNAIIQPGTAIGAIGAQSIGEPATQMTLKTFHFAGVAAMNITLGVPRIKEIINASANIKTPIIMCELDNDLDEDFARQIKMQIEKTKLGQICESIEDVVISEGCFILIKLHSKRIEFLKLKVTIYSIIESVCNSKFCKSININEQDIMIYSNSIFAINLSRSPNMSHISFKTLKFDLMEIIVKGYSSVNRAIISVDDTEGKNRYKLLVEGTNILAVMTTVGVVGTSITSNDIIEIAKTIGIEAARGTIIHEIEYTMKSHGMNIDKRHIMLLADIMTSQFEKTSQHLFEAAYYGQCDKIKGVSESIIMGIPMKIGTGIFSIIKK